MCYILEYTKTTQSYINIQNMIYIIYIEYISKILLVVTHTCPAA